jgi:hypothetical protein
MAHLTLNCPTCRKRLVYVPLDGLTLHYRCEQHGLLIFKPVVQITSDEQMPPNVMQSSAPHHAHDAA